MKWACRKLFLQRRCKRSCKYCSIRLISFNRSPTRFLIYFDQVHPCIPMINKTRFLAARRLGLNGPSIFALQYAMWSIAASVSPKYGRLCEVFLQRARKYTEQIELDVSWSTRVRGLANRILGNWRASDYYIRRSKLVFDCQC